MSDRKDESPGIHVSPPSIVATTTLLPRDSIVIHQVLDPELDAIGRAHDDENLSLAFFSLTSSLSLSTVFTALTATTEVVVAIAWSVVVLATIVAIFFCILWRRARTSAKQKIEQIRRRVSPIVS